MVENYNKFLSCYVQFLLYKPLARIGTVSKTFVAYERKTFRSEREGVQLPCLCFVQSCIRGADTIYYFPNVSQVQNSKSRGMSACIYALNTVCPQFFFFSLPVDASPKKWPKLQGSYCPPPCMTMVKCHLLYQATFNKSIIYHVSCFNFTINNIILIFPIWIEAMFTQSVLAK